MCAERCAAMADGLTSESAEFLITNVKIYKELIIKHVKCGPIIGKVVIADEYHTLKEAMLVDVRNGQNSAATSKLLDYLDKMEDPRQYRHFVQLIDEHVDVNRFNITVIGEYSTIPGALVNTGNYCYLGKLLRGEKTLDPKKHKEHCRLIEFFSQEISHRIDFRLLYEHLVEGHWMDEEDSQLLRRLNENNGRSSACSWLLYCVLPMRKENWLKQFLQLLRDIGYPELVEYITGEKCEAVKSASDYADSDMELDDRFDSERMDVVEEAVKSDSDYADSDIGLSDELGSLRLNIVEASGEERKQLGNLDTASSTLNILTPVDIDKWVTVYSKNDDYEDFGDDVSALSSVEDNYIQSEFEEDDVSPSLIQARENILPLENRPYQEELAEAAVNGENVIIIAPTGCGKTVVALNIMMAHLYKKGDKGKIAFFANEVILVDQQHGLCRGHLPQTVKTCMLAGERKSKSSVPIADLFKLNDIVFMTPQILVDSLADKSLASLSVFSLLVFDECHHVLSKHPTSRIMSSYIDMKLDAAGPLPQVVGLTASVGVGKSKSGIELDAAGPLPQVVGLTASVGVGKRKAGTELNGAIKHIRTLCAKLDTFDGLVTVKKNKESLAKYTHFVQSAIKTAVERTTDTFRDCIVTIMKKIEESLVNMASKLGLWTLDEDEVKVGVLAGVDKGTRAYHQWLSQWYYVILPRCRKAEVRRVCITCIQHLNDWSSSTGSSQNRSHLPGYHSHNSQIYNKVLLINTDCRAQDALVVVEEGMRMLHPQENTCEKNNWMYSLYQEKHQTLKRNSRPGYNLNPKLILLQLEISDQRRMKYESKIIILMSNSKTRDLTRALLRWMTEDDQLKALNPVIVTGCGASDDKGGMTRAQQIAAVKSFKWGSSHVAIATSVAEEGLDIIKCSRVIRYEYVSNEIGTIQAKGRASREEGGSYSLITANSSLARQEETNARLETVMADAVESLQEEFDLDPAKWKTDLLQCQREDQLARDIEKKQQQHRPKNTDVFQLKCYKCGSFVCYSSDIRVLNGSHRFVMTPIGEKIYEVVHKNKKEFDDISKISKIHCKVRDCHIDWGVGVIYMDLKFAVLALKNLLIISQDDRERQYHRKKWKDAPFTCQELTQDDILNYTQSLKMKQCEVAYSICVC